MQENQPTTQENNAYNSAYEAHDRQTKIKIKPYQYLLIGVAGVAKLLLILFCVILGYVVIETANHSFIEVDKDAKLGSMSFKYPSNWEVYSQNESNMELKGGNECLVSVYYNEIWKENEISTQDEQSNVDKYLNYYTSVSSSVSPNFESKTIYVNDCKGSLVSYQPNDGTGRFICRIAIYDGYKVDAMVLEFPNVSYSSLVSKIADSITINKHTHKEGNWTTEAQATCSQEGREVCDCEGSDHKLVKTTAKLNHMPGDWTVQKDYSVSSSGIVTPGTEVRNCTVCGEQVDSRTYTITLTKSQQNACKAAQSYLKSQSFSYSGLIKQLEFEKYSNEDATFAVDHCGADWNEQAAKTAQSYLKTMSFSRGELIDQLVFEGFSTEQAEYGVNSVGL